MQFHSGLVPSLHSRPGPTAPGKSPACRGLAVDFVCACRSKLVRCLSLHSRASGAAAKLNVALTWSTALVFLIGLAMAAAEDVKLCNDKTYACHKSTHVCADASALCRLECAKDGACSQMTYTCAEGSHCVVQCGVDGENGASVCEEPVRAGLPPPVAADLGLPRVSE